MHQITERKLVLDAEVKTTVAKVPTADSSDGFMEST